MNTRETSPPEFNKMRIPAELYVQIEERLNARWAAARQKRALLEKRTDLSRAEKRGGVL